MRIAIRTDASVDLGTGHVMRCLALADALRDHGAECTFVCKPHPGHLMGLIGQRGHSVVSLPSPAEARCFPFRASSSPLSLGADWAMDASQTRQALGFAPIDYLVVDHYGLDYRWEQVMQETCCRLLVIDDLANRRHICKILLDPNLGRNPQDYIPKLNPEADLLIGPQYALLRPEFSELRKQSLARRETFQLKKILVSMGGVDKDNHTSAVLTALANCSLDEELEIIVVMGPTASWLDKVRQSAMFMTPKTHILCNVQSMSRLMSDCDLAIGAAGGTAWERCCMGIPAFLLIQADNQRQGALALEKAGAAVLLTCADEIPAKLNELLTDTISTRLTNMSRMAASITDGLGAQRVVEKVFNDYA